MSNKEKISFPDSLKFYTPNQRVVYGGGGIMPDIFIPMDTSKFSPYYNEILKKGLVRDFSLHYVDINRTQFEADYSTFQKFESNFSTNEAYMEEFDKFVIKREIDEEGIDDKVSRSKVNNHIKALVARSLFDIEAYHQVINQTDDAFTQAVQLLENFKGYNSKIALK